jgi:simple sugar transport system ATP-binding protein
VNETSLQRDGQTPIIELRGVSKYFGSVVALEDVSVSVNPGEVVCLLGDNGAGKSTVIKIMSGVFPPDAGQMFVDGEAVHFRFAHDARERGIATVFQDLAVMPLMSVTRNFFLGSELITGWGWGPLRRFDRKAADEIARSELLKMGIDLRDTSQLAGTLSGGERQSLAIARAIYFGARVVILDEPTSALGIKEAGIVLRYIVLAKARGLGVVLITHNPSHAYPVGDRFTILDRGHSLGTYDKAELQPVRLLGLMSGGAELEELTHELHALAQSLEASSPRSQ